MLEWAMRKKGIPEVLVAVYLEKNARISDESI